MLNTSTSRVGAFLAGAMVGVFLLVAVPGCQWGDGLALLPPDMAAIEATLDDGVLRARIETALLLSPVVGSTRIAVDVVQGAALLSGATDDPVQVELALFVVTNVPGVIRVESILLTRAQAQASAAGQREVLDVGAARASFVRNGTLIPMPGPDRAEPMFLQRPVAGEANEADGAALQANAASNSSASFATRSRVMIYGVLGIASVHDELLIKR
ncbi:BON domain-containing protein [Acidovorax sp.]|uniref:BON domain-containing protein n=1 Tax=Acidovorax sp. TaxID=1872122 RepID=UPI002ACE85BB|nr:BON domain-containing protein [Acidovorax sp.]MDZ7863779.1 BON domain-containing protein [Acidovorax sp.]